MFVFARIFDRKIRDFSLAGNADNAIFSNINKYHICRIAGPLYSLCEVANIWNCFRIVFRTVFNFIYYGSRDPFILCVTLSLQELYFLYIFFVLRNSKVLCVRHSFSCFLICIFSTIHTHFSVILSTTTNNSATNKIVFSAVYKKLTPFSQQVTFLNLIKQTNTDTTV